MTFIVNGVDIAPYIANRGLEYQLSDIDAPGTGRTMDGTMQRGKITDKDKWMIKCRPLTTSELSTVLSAVTHEYVTCTYLSPRYNQTVTKTLYVGDRKAAHYIERNNGTILWTDVAFNLIEQ